MKELRDQNGKLNSNNLFSITLLKLTQYIKIHYAKSRMLYLQQIVNCNLHNLMKLLIKK
ncbi:MAG: hypothetical protein ACI9VT_001989 [Psychroserpens sp.]|jgi:hypothetical protein